jgi:hypothetical protein
VWGRNGRGGEKGLVFFGHCVAVTRNTAAGWFWNVSQVGA